MYQDGSPTLPGEIRTQEGYTAVSVMDEDGALRWKVINNHTRETLVTEYLAHTSHWKAVKICPHLDKLVEEQQLIEQRGLSSELPTPNTR